MKKVVVNIVSAAALTLGMAAATNGMAATSQNFSNHTSGNGAGIFVSGNLGYGTSGYSKSYYTNSVFGSQPTSYNDDAFAWAANAGYQFNRYLALEAGYISFGQSKATSTLPATMTNTFGGFDAAAKGILPINNQFNVFAKAGVVDMHENVNLSSGSVSANIGNGNSWAPLLGVGTAYNINKNVALTVQDDYAFQTHYKKSGTTYLMPSANAILGGVSFKFNM
ncbi:MAG TPA: outer membrane beta-barrel protein [Coxiellaceae bacterium]|nr:MAG: hypothetical protein A3E81_06295 [Gammaproteobacteria bacterium RIFCSPHIGHO2_12_FULL_36_30]HLB56845.1 outer membrane beta-barrel protein [Coxiellaceae bacterium]